MLFLLAFTSADIFPKFLELHSTLSGKKIFFTNFLFLMDSLNESAIAPEEPLDAVSTLVNG